MILLIGIAVGQDCTYRLNYSDFYISANEVLALPLDKLFDGNALTFKIQQQDSFIKIQQTLEIRANSNLPAAFTSIYYEKTRGGTWTGYAVAIDSSGKKYKSINRMADRASFYEQFLFVQDLMNKMPSFKIGHTYYIQNQAFIAIVNSDNDLELLDTSLTSVAKFSKISQIQQLQVDNRGNIYILDNESISVLRLFKDQQKKQITLVKSFNLPEALTFSVSPADYNQGMPILIDIIFKSNASTFVYNDFTKTLILQSLLEEGSFKQIFSLNDYYLIADGEFLVVYQRQNNRPVDASSIAGDIYLSLTDSSPPLLSLIQSSQSTLASLQQPHIFIKSDQTKDKPIKIQATGAISKNPCVGTINLKKAEGFEDGYQIQPIKPVRLRDYQNYKLYLDNHVVGNGLVPVFTDKTFQYSFNPYTTSTLNLTKQTQGATFFDAYDSLIDKGMIVVAVQNKVLKIFRCSKNLQFNCTLVKSQTINDQLLSGTYGFDVSSKNQYFAYITANDQKNVNIYLFLLNKIQKILTDEPVSNQFVALSDSSAGLLAARKNDLVLISFSQLTFRVAADSISASAQGVDTPIFKCRNIIANEQDEQQVLLQVFNYIMVGRMIEGKLKIQSWLPQSDIDPALKIKARFVADKIVIAKKNQQINQIKVYNKRLQFLYDLYLFGGKIIDNQILGTSRFLFLRYDTLSVYVYDLARGKIGQLLYIIPIKDTELMTSLDIQSEPTLISASSEVMKVNVERAIQARPSEQKIDNKLYINSLMYKVQVKSLKGETNLKLSSQFKVINSNLRLIAQNTTQQSKFQVSKLSEDQNYSVDVQDYSLFKGHIFQYTFNSPNNSDFLKYFDVKTHFRKLKEEPLFSALLYADFRSLWVVYGDRISFVNYKNQKIFDDISIQAKLIPAAATVNSQNTLGFAVHYSDSDKAKMIVSPIQLSQKGYVKQSGSGFQSQVPKSISKCLSVKEQLYLMDSIEHSIRQFKYDSVNKKIIYQKTIKSQTTDYFTDFDIVVPSSSILILLPTSSNRLLLQVFNNQLIDQIQIDLNQDPYFSKQSFPGNYLKALKVINFTESETILKVIFYLVTSESITIQFKLSLDIGKNANDITTYKFKQLKPAQVFNRFNYFQVLPQIQAFHDDTQFAPLLLSYRNQGIIYLTIYFGDTNYQQLEIQDFREGRQFAFDAVQAVLSKNGSDYYLYLLTGKQFSIFEIKDDLRFSYKAIKFQLKSKPQIFRISVSNGFTSAETDLKLKWEESGLSIWIIIAIGVAVALLLVGIGIWLYCRKKARDGRLLEDETDDL